MKPIIIIVLFFCSILILAVQKENRGIKSVHPQELGSFDDLRYGKDENGGFIIYNVNGEVVFREKLKIYETLIK